MINGALKVFALSGYKHASTDDIVKEAGISKGLLFHYFTSKIGLYGFLFDYSAKFMLLEMSREIRSSETDLFELTRQMEKARMQVMKLFPYMQQFLNVCLAETCPEAVSEIEEKRSTYAQQMESYMAQADYSELERFGDSERIRRMMRYTIAGITQEMAERYDFTPEKLYQEITEYIAMLERMMRQENAEQNASDKGKAEMNDDIWNMSMKFERIQRGQKR